MQISYFFVCIRTFMLGILLSILSVSLSAAPKDNTLNIAFDAAPASLDAYKESDRPGLALARMVFSGLVQKNHQTQKFEPAIAASYKFIDNKTIDFVIRDDVYFHNGEKLTVDDVLYTLQLITSDKFTVRFQNTVEWIKKVEKVASNTIRIHMKEPYPLALEMLSENLPIYPKKYYSSNPSLMGSKPIGTGPYKLVQSVTGSRYVYEAFDKYYGTKPAIKKLTVRILPDANTQYAELMKGNLDWIWRLPPEAAKKIAQNKGIDVLSTSIMRITYISLNPNYNNGKSPLANLKVRQALNHAIDREAIRKALIGGSSELIYSACNTKQFGCTSAVQKYEYNPQKAIELLKQAGYPKGFTIELVVAQGPKTAFEAIAQQLKKVGVVVNISEQQFGTAVSNWREGKIPMLAAGWGSYGIADVSLSTSNFFKGGADDMIKDPQIIKWLIAGDTTINSEQRVKNYHPAVQKIAAQAYWIPLWTHSLNYAQSKSLSFAVDNDEFPRFYKAKWK